MLNIIRRTFKSFSDFRKESIENFDIFHTIELNVRKF